MAHCKDYMLCIIAVISFTLAGISHVSVAQMPATPPGAPGAPVAAPGTPAAAPGTPAGAPGVQPMPAQPGQQSPPCHNDTPVVDVEIVPQRHWKTALPEVQKIKRRLKRFIREEIMKTSNRLNEERNMMSFPESVTQNFQASPYEKYVKLPSQSPALVQFTHPRFQEISAHDTQSGLDNLATDAVQNLQKIFDGNQVGAFLDMHQGVPPGQYLEALSQALTQAQSKEADEDSHAAAEKGNDTANILEQKAPEHPEPPAITPAAQLPNGPIAFPLPKQV